MCVQCLICFFLLFIQGVIVHGKTKRKRPGKITNTVCQKYKSNLVWNADKVPNECEKENP